MSDDEKLAEEFAAEFAKVAAEYAESTKQAIALLERISQLLQRPKK